MDLLEFAPRFEPAVLRACGSVVIATDATQVSSSSLQVFVFFFVSRHVVSLFGQPVLMRCPRMLGCAFLQTARHRGSAEAHRIFQVRHINSYIVEIVFPARMLALCMWLHASRLACAPLRQGSNRKPEFSTLPHQVPKLVRAGVACVDLRGNLARPGSLEVRCVF